jgi:hypothetical protein
MRFVVLHHTGWPGRADHYDLMLQFAEGGSDDDRVFKTFATVEDQFPTGSPASNLQRIEDHRREYLTFEGTLSGNRGRVSRVDSGEIFEGPSGVFELRGSKLSGKFRLVNAAGIYSFQRV